MVIRTYTLFANLVGVVIQVFDLDDGDAIVWIEQNKVWVKTVEEGLDVDLPLIAR